MTPLVLAFWAVAVLAAAANMKPADIHARVRLVSKGNIIALSSSLKRCIEAGSWTILLVVAVGGPRSGVPK
jgi:hypothetical protein